MPGIVDVHPHPGHFRYGLHPQKQREYYAQLAYGFNYYGTVGANRDEFVIIRKMKKVDWLEQPLAAKGSR